MFESSLLALGLLVGVSLVLLLAGLIVGRSIIRIGRLNKLISSLEESKTDVECCSVTGVRLGPRRLKSSVGLDDLTKTEERSWIDEHMEDAGDTYLIWPRASSAERKPCQACGKNMLRAAPPPQGNDRFGSEAEVRRGEPNVRFAP